MFSPVVGPLFWGHFAASMGIWTHNLASAVLAYSLTGSAGFVGLVTALQFLPQVLLGPWAGALSDRGNLARQIATGRLVCAGGSGGLGVWAIATAGTGPPAWPVAACSCLVGVGIVIGGPSSHALMPTLVRPGELRSVTVLSNLPSTLARVFGPALATVVAIRFGAGVSLAIAAATNALSGLVFAWMSQRIPRRTASGGSSIRTSVLAVWRDPPLLLLFLSAMVISTGSDPSTTLTPAMAAGYDGGDGLVGVLATSFGAGAAVGIFTIPWWTRYADPARLTWLALVMMGGCLAVVALAGPLALTVVFFTLAGVGMGVALITTTYLLQHRVAPGIRGRVTSLWFVAFLGARPVAALLSGTVADHSSVEAALGVVAALVLAGASACSPRRLTRRHIAN